MASQQPRPAWFRFSALANRPAAPTPTPDPAPPPPPPPVAQVAPIRPPAPVPAIVRPTIPSIPIRPSFAPTQTREPAPPPPPAVASPPSTAAPPPAVAPPRSPVATPAQAVTASPRSPVATPAQAVTAPPRSPVATPATAPPRSPVATPAQVVTAPPRSPVATPTLTAAPPSSPPAQVAAPPRSPVVPPAPQLSPRVPAATLPSQTSPPPPTYIAPQPTSPVPKAPLTNSTNGPVASSSITASPKTKTKLPSSSIPTSPVPRPMANAVALTATGSLKATTPDSSPKIVKPLEKTPAQSPKVKPLSNPPSPFTLPPAQKTEDESELKIPAEVEQKTVLVQETIEKPMKMPNAHNAVASNEKRDSAMKVRGNGKKNSDSEELGMRVITLAGENKGAVMELSPSQKKKYSVGNPQSLHKNKNNISGRNGDQSSSESGEEGKSNKKDKTNRAMAMQSPPMTAFLNSNVQGVNNSIISNCHCRHNDPGVHLSLNRKTNGNPSKDHHG